MKDPKFNLLSADRKMNDRIFFFICIVLGTLVRLYYGYSSQIWNSAHDQIAWTYSLRDAQSEGWLFRLLIHYPYEGGTLPISILTLSVCFFQNLIPALSLSALILDLGIRYLQIIITKKVFDANTARWFALWHILAIPLMLPWGTAFFGLHAINNIFPFIFLTLCSSRYSFSNRPILSGAIFAGMIVFSYHNIILLVAYLFLALASKITFDKKQWLKFFLSLIVVLLLHVLVRLKINHGFNIEDFALISVRGESWMQTTLSVRFNNVFQFWTNSFPDALILNPGWPVLQKIGFWYMALTLLLMFFVLLRNKRLKNPNILAITVVLLLFSIFYAFSIFFTVNPKTPTFYGFRHLTYIVPIFVVLVMDLFSNISRIGKYFCYSFIFVCGLDSITFINHLERIPEPEHKVAGWILSRKYGDEPERLLNIAEDAKVERKTELLYGYAWGLTAHLMRTSHAKDTLQINRLCKSINAFHLRNRTVMLKGIRYAFSSGVTPKLDSTLLPLIESRLDSSAYLYK